MNDYQYMVYERIKRKPHLEPIWTTTHEIPERLREYNETFFMVFNHSNRKFEIHSIEQVGDSYCMIVPFRTLDIRTLRYVWNNDIRVHGKNIFRRLEQQEQALEKRQKRERQNWIQDMAEETQSMFAQDAWKFAT